jgi:hypothetical protein
MATKADIDAALRRIARLAARGNPKPKPRCNAPTRDGGTCQAQAGKCRWHAPAEASTVAVPFGVRNFVLAPNWHLT